MQPSNHATMQPLIWALTDGRPGNDNQVIAVAAALGEYENHQIEFSPSAGLPNFLLGTSDLGIITKLDAPWPNIVIAAGRKLSRVARIIKKESPQNNKTKIIQLMWPGYGASDFDIIFTPEHDNLKPRKNVIATNGPPNLMTPQLLKASAEKWQARIPIDEKPAIAVLIGNISEDEVKKLASDLNSTTGYLMITTSRRTPPNIIAILKDRLTRERYLYEWAPNAENPYLGFVALADFIIVTEDSISMMSECVTSGKPTYIFPVDVPEKHKRFSQSLFNSGKARLLKGENLESYNYEPLDTLGFIVGKIQNIVILSNAKDPSLRSG